MSNPLLTTPHSKIDTRVKEPSGVQTPHNCFIHTNSLHKLFICLNTNEVVIKHDMNFYLN